MRYNLSSDKGFISSITDASFLIKKQEWKHKHKQNLLDIKQSHVVTSQPLNSKHKRHYQASTDYSDAQTPACKLSK